jgi:diacylglycerol kinase family enzyme
MRKAALLYNPDSGGRGRRRLKDLESALAVLRNGGVEAGLVPTESRHHAGDEVRQAVAAGCDTVFACGGDGTIHNIAQVLANTPVALAILPMGTANALAHDLGVPTSLKAAAEVALRGKPKRIALGCARYRKLDGSAGQRYFLVATGVGMDAHLFYTLHSGDKQRLGMAAYYAKAWNMWFTYPMTRFVIEYEENSSGALKRASVTELLNVRIRNFGGVVQELAPGASLERDDMRIVYARTASRLAYLAYVTRGLLRRRWTIPGVDLAHTAKVSCRYAESEARGAEQPKVYVEADGELLGTLPVEMTTVPDALTLLAPAN